MGAPDLDCKDCTRFELRPDEPKRDDGVQAARCKQYDAHIWADKNMIYCPGGERKVTDDQEATPEPVTVADVVGLIMDIGRRIDALETAVKDRLARIEALAVKGPGKTKDETPPAQKAAQAASGAKAKASAKKKD